MPYRVSPNGVIECDTAAEAVELQSLIAERAPRGRGIPRRRLEQPEIPDVPEGPDYAGFWKELNKTGRRFFAVLASENVPVSSRLLAERSGISTTELPSKMIHVRRTARRCRIPEPVIRESQLTNGKMMGMYRLSDEVREALKDQLTEVKGAQK